MTKQLKSSKMTNLIASARYDRSEEKRRTLLPGCSAEELDARAKAVTEVLKRLLNFPLPLPK
jgi:hypothetical protein